MTAPFRMCLSCLSKQLCSSRMFAVLPRGDSCLDFDCSYMGRVKNGDGQNVSEFTAHGFQQKSTHITDMIKTICPTSCYRLHTHLGVCCSGASAVF